ncbi:MAG: hypothetical protein IPK79_10860 [Vampirovibrionales bacterium]|nr:hypothetical protein [Vampirovibrionales bacterium]
MVSINRFSPPPAASPRFGMAFTPEAQVHHEANKKIGKVVIALDALKDPNSEISNALLGPFNGWNERDRSTLDKAINTWAKSKDIVSLIGVIQKLNSAEAIIPDEIIMPLNKIHAKKLKSKELYQI